MEKPICIILPRTEGMALKFSCWAKKYDRLLHIAVGNITAEKPLNPYIVINPKPVKCPVDPLIQRLSVSPSEVRYMDDATGRSGVTRADSED